MWRKSSQNPTLYPLSLFPEVCLAIARLVLTRARLPKALSSEWSHYSETTLLVLKTNLGFFSLPPFMCSFFHSFARASPLFFFLYFWVLFLSLSHLPSRSSISPTHLLSHLKYDPSLFISWVFNLSCIYWLVWLRFAWIHLNIMSFAFSITMWMRKSLYWRYYEEILIFVEGWVKVLVLDLCRMHHMIHKDASLDSLLHCILSLVLCNVTNCYMLFYPLGSLEVIYISVDMAMSFSAHLVFVEMSKWTFALYMFDNLSLWLFKLQNGS